MFWLKYYNNLFFIKVKYDYLTDFYKSILCYYFDDVLIPSLGAFTSFFLISVMQ